MPTKRLIFRRANASYNPELTLHEFDWGNLVEARFFEQMLVGIVGVIIGLVGVASQSVSVPPLIIIDPWLSLICVALAFARVWKTIREEHETARLWDTVSAASGNNELILDRVFEIPYLLTITVLPIAAVSPQLFMFVLFLFYACDNYYNAALARGVEPENPEEGYGEALGTAIRRIGWLSVKDVDDPRRAKVTSYFLKRSRFDSAFMLLLVVGFIGIALALLFEQRAGAWLLAFGVVATILFIEIFVEPIRNRGMTFVPEDDSVLDEITIVDATSRAALPDGVADQLKEIHEEAFGPEEQQYTMEDIISGARLADPLLRIVTLDKHVVGYAFLESVAKEATAFLWYVAIKAEHRGGGIGAYLIRETLARLRADEKLRYVFFEVHKPAEHESAEGVDRRRIEFYRRLGAYWVRGVDYRIPAANDGSNSVAYDPMFFVLRGKFAVGEVADRVARMAADNFDDRPTDERWMALKASLPSLTIVSPDEKLGVV